MDEISSIINEGIKVVLFFLQKDFTRIKSTKSTKYKQATFAQMFFIRTKSTKSIKSIKSIKHKQATFTQMFFMHIKSLKSTKSNFHLDAFYTYKKHKKHIKHKTSNK